MDTSEQLIIVNEIDKTDSIVSIRFRGSKCDIAFKNCHVGLVVAVSNNGFTVAEERGYKYGLVITEHKYSKSTFTNIVLMDNFYNNYKKGTSLWNGFK